jgi:hypothetical protein
MNIWIREVDEVLKLERIEATVKSVDIKTIVFNFVSGQKLSCVRIAITGGYQNRITLVHLDLKLSEAEVALRNLCSLGRWSREVRMAIVCIRLYCKGV